MKRLLAFSLVASVLLPSCVEEVDREVRDIAPQLVVTCFFTAGEPFRVYLSGSYSPFYGSGPQLVRGAEVKVYENGSYLGDLEFEVLYYERADTITDGVSMEVILTRFPVDSCYTGSTVLPRVGHEYRLEVSAPGYKSVSATSRVPGVVGIDSLSKRLRGYDFYGTAVEGGCPVYYLSFTDPPGPNYYMVSMFGYNNKAYGLRDYKMDVSYSSDDPVIGKFESDGNQFERLLAFPDLLFSGREYHLMLMVNEGRPFSDGFYYKDTLEITLTLNNLSSDFEYYVKSQLETDKYQGNPLREPIPIYTNVESGLGIFAGYSSSKRTKWFTTPEIDW